MTEESKKPDNIIVNLSIDFDLLREQKHELIKKACASGSTNELLDGIISIIDAIQDQAVENNGLSEVEVFGPDSEGEDEAAA